MKTLIIALSLLTVFASVSSAMAGGSSWFALNQKWKQVEAWQKQQAAQFRALEREAASQIEGLLRESSHTRTKERQYPYTPFPASSRCGDQR